MIDMVALAHAALIDAGHPELCQYVTRNEALDLPMVHTPCPNPHMAIKAVALSHQAVGHTITVYNEEFRAGFDCIECGFVSDLSPKVEP